MRARGWSAAVNGSENETKIKDRSEGVFNQARAGGQLPSAGQKVVPTCAPKRNKYRYYHMYHAPESACTKCVNKLVKYVKQNITINIVLKCGRNIDNL